jgi:hypothetical protein
MNEFLNFTYERTDRLTSLNSHPHVVSANFTIKSVQRVPRDGGTPAGFELKSPAVHGADGFSLLNPAESHRTIGVRAAAQQCVKGAAIVKDRDGKSFDFNPNRSALGDILNPADGHEKGHASKPVWAKRFWPNLKDSDLRSATPFQ